MVKSVGNEMIQLGVGLLGQAEEVEEERERERERKIGVCGSEGWR